MDPEPWLTDLLWDKPDGYYEVHPNGVVLFKWLGQTFEVWRVEGDPDLLIIRGTGQKHKVDAAVGTCVCKGFKRWGRCKHAETGQAVLPIVRSLPGATSNEADEEDELSEEQLKALFA